MQSPSASTLLSAQEWNVLLNTLRELARNILSTSAGLISEYAFVGVLCDARVAANAGGVIGEGGDGFRLSACLVASGPLSFRVVA